MCSIWQIPNRLLGQHLKRHNDWLDVKKVKFILHKENVLLVEETQR